MLLRTCHRGRVQIEKHDHTVSRGRKHCHLDPSILDFRKNVSAAQALRLRPLDMQASVTRYINSAVFAGLGNRCICFLRATAY